MTTRILKMIKNRKYIIDIDNIYWRASIRIGVDRISKCFNFNKWGGKLEALNGARDWRDKLLIKHGLTDRIGTKQKVNIFRKHAKTPFIGVYNTVHRRDGNRYINWTARYSIDKQETKRHFSIFKYGYDEAFQMACEVRYQYCGEIIMTMPFHLKPKVPFVRRYMRG